MGLEDRSLLGNLPPPDLLAHPARTKPKNPTIRANKLTPVIRTSTNNICTEYQLRECFPTLPNSFQAASNSCWRKLNSEAKELSSFFWCLGCVMNIRAAVQEVSSIRFAFCTTVSAILLHYPCPYPLQRPWEVIKPGPQLQIPFTLIHRELLWGGTTTSQFILELDVFILPIFHSGYTVGQVKSSLVMGKKNNFSSSHLHKVAI